ncbi:MAG: GLPGLI family protein [Bacteroidetes bacterium]|nr:GLPGLI family protein [Bacteroidota bacterium]
MNRIKALILMLCCLQAKAQFTDTAVVVYEKKTNLHKMFENQGDWFEQMKKMIPKYKVESYTLQLLPGQSFYYMSAESDARLPAWMTVSSPAEILSGFDSSRLLVRKEILDKNYLIADSLPVYNWHVMAERRSIAGYECRKAWTKVKDSLLLFAWYAEELLLPAGPETVQGLPGTILGMAVPEMHTTWFATSVQVKKPVLQVETPLSRKMKKAKPVSYRQVETTLQDLLKDWDKGYKKRIIMALL